MSVYTPDAPSPGVRSLVAEPSAEARATLLHLLTCPNCHGWALSRLQGTPLREPEPDYSSVWLSLEGKAALLVAEAAHQRTENEALLQSLSSRPEGEWRQLATEARYAQLTFGAFLLEEAKERAHRSPRRSVALAELAFRIGERVAERDHDGGGLDLIAHAATVAAGAHRARGDRRGAERFFRLAAARLGAPADAWERGYYARALALQRWEAGVYEEAVALLSHARRVFAAAGEPADQAAAMALLGLLWSERAELARAVPLLVLARQGFSLEDSGWLGARVAFHTAFLEATNGASREARASLELAGPLLARAASEDEAATLCGLQGQALSRLGEPEGEELLDDVRRTWLRLERLPEAGLASLALLGARVEKGRAPNLEPLARDLLAVFPPGPRTTTVLCALAGFEEVVREGQPARRAEDLSAATLRQQLRLEGARVEPLPFL